MKISMRPPTAEEQREQTASAWLAQNDPERATLSVMIAVKMREIEEVWSC